MGIERQFDCSGDVSQTILDELIIQAEKDGVQKILAGAQIYRNGKLLLLVRAAGEFMEGLVELPSGTIDFGETLIEGLVREVKEETGLDVENVARYIDFFDYSSGSGKKTRQFNFLIKVSDGDVILNPKEHSEYIFIDPKTANFKTLGVSEAVKDSVEKAI